MDLNIQNQLNDKILRDLIYREITFKYHTRTSEMLDVNQNLP